MKRVRLQFAEGSVENGTLTYRYYHVGQKDPLARPPLCNRDIPMGANRTCTHDWLTLYSDVVTDKDAARAKYLEEIENGALEYSGYEPAFADDIYERVAYGESHHWCWKCGWHLIPTGRPNFELPAAGNPFED